MSNELQVTTTEFLSAIFDVEGGLPENEAVCVARLNTEKGFFYQITPEGRAFQRWSRDPFKRPEAWYFTISTVAPADETGKLRRRNQDAVASYCVVLDDVGTKVDPDKIPVDPSWELETSPGNFQWGYLLDPEENVDKVAALIDALAEAGYTDPGAKGVTRVVRLPGSANFKGEEPYYARLMTWSPERVWTLDELIEAFGVTLGEVKPKSPGPVPLARQLEGVEVIDPVLVWLDEQGVIRDARDNDGFLTITCPWAETHTDGDTKAFYSPLGVGQRPDLRGFKCFHAHCQTRRYKDFRAWVEDNEGPGRPGYDPLPFLQQKYVALTQGQEAQVVSLPGLRSGHENWCWTANAWSVLHPGRINVDANRTVKVSTAFLEDEGTSRAAGVTYDPAAEPGALVTSPSDPDHLLLNLYRRPRHEEIDEEPEIFLDHIDYLLPDPEERDCFLDWLAYKVQHPATRSYAVVMVADEAYGIGRSWLHHFLRQVFLPAEVKPAQLSSVLGLGNAGGYNDWGNDCQLVVVEEARDTVKREDFYHSYEHLKQMVDTRPVEMRINPKFGRTRLATLWFNLLVFTNHLDALLIPEGDRRIAVFTNPRQRQGNGYYARLEGALDGQEAARAYRWLSRRDVSAFDAQRAPETAAKANMIKASISSLEEIANWVVAEYPSELITRDQLIPQLQAAAMACGSPDLVHDTKALAGTGRRLWRRLVGLKPDDPHNGMRVRVGGGGQQEVRALRNPDAWIRRLAQLSPEMRRAAVLKELEKRPTVEAGPFGT